MEYASTTATLKTGPPVKITHLFGKKNVPWHRPSEPPRCHSFCSFNSFRQLLRNSAATHGERLNADDSSARRQFQINLYCDYWWLDLDWQNYGLWENGHSTLGTAVGLTTAVKHQQLFATACDGDSVTTLFDQSHRWCLQWLTCGLTLNRCLQDESNWSPGAACNDGEVGLTMTDYIANNLDATSRWKDRWMDGFTFVKLLPKYVTLTPVGVSSPRKEWWQNQSVVPPVLTDW